MLGITTVGRSHGIRISQALARSTSYYIRTTLVQKCTYFVPAMVENRMIKTLLGQYTDIQRLVLVLPIK